LVGPQGWFQNKDRDEPVIALRADFPESALSSQRWRAHFKSVRWRMEKARRTAKKSLRV
jgi:hypothetical protein